MAVLDRIPVSVTISSVHFLQMTLVITAEVATMMVVRLTPPLTVVHALPHSIVRTIPVVIVFSAVEDRCVADMHRTHTACFTLNSMVVPPAGRNAHVTKVVAEGYCLFDVGLCVQDLLL